jgi:Zn-finger nucleic acid-binding protein
MDCPMCGNTMKLVDVRGVDYYRCPKCGNMELA